MIRFKRGHFKKGESMKKTLLTLLLLGLVVNVYGGTTEERHDFYTYYDPLNPGAQNATYVYNEAGATSTGDQVVVNGYTRKTIQISPITVGEYIHIRIEGRSKDMLDTPNWAILDEVQFGNSSADTSKNVVVDVTEIVDFLRVGIRSEGSAGQSKIYIRGIFTNLER
jgi:hypothetical protein